MAKQKSPINEQMVAFADELNNIHNSDELHQLFDILCDYEGDGGSADDECGRFIQKFIERALFKEISDPAAKKEIQFIFESLRRAIRSQKFYFESPQVRDDLVANAVEKIIRNTKYDLTAPERKKHAFIKTVLSTVHLDFCRARSSERDAAERFVHGVPTIKKKKSA